VFSPGALQGLVGFADDQFKDLFLEQTPRVLSFSEDIFCPQLS